MKAQAIFLLSIVVRECISLQNARRKFWGFSPSLPSPWKMSTLFVGVTIRHVGMGSAGCSKS